MIQLVKHFNNSIAWYDSFICYKMLARVTNALQDDAMTDSKCYKITNRGDNGSVLELRY